APEHRPEPPSPPTLSPNGERECIEFAARSYAIARLAHQRSPSVRASSASRKRQPLLRQKLKSHLRRMSSSPANSTRVWIRFARSTLTRSLCSPTSLKQWENCNGNSSAEAPTLGRAHMHRAALEYDLRALHRDQLLGCCGGIDECFGFEQGGVFPDPV